MNLVLRRFRGDADLPLMVDVANASLSADGFPDRRTLDGLRKDYAALVNCDPATDMVLAEVDGVLAGSARGRAALTQAAAACSSHFSAAPKSL